MTAPTKAPRNCAMIYPGTRPQARLPVTALAMVTAGVIRAAGERATQKKAHATPPPPPKVIAIQPQCPALEFLSSPPATTPSPRMIRIIVPINSPIYACIDHSPLERSPGRHGARRGQVGLLLVVSRQSSVRLHLVVELQQRYGESRHLQRGHVISDVGHPEDLDALALEHVG